MLPNLILKASEDPILSFGAGSLATFVLGIVGILIRRALKKSDDEKKTVSDRLDDLREFVGVQKRENAAIWRNVEDLKESVEKLHDKVYESKR